MSSTLKKSLGPWMLWGLGVGYVISGNYFGWNLGLAEGGTLGMAIALAAVILMYSFFTFCYTELACAIPKAGGAFDYTSRGLGKKWGLIAGTAQVIEFLFAPPAIALGLGAYLQEFFPQIQPMTTAIAAYLIFTLLNMSGVKTAASFELFVTLVAVSGLLLFAVNVIPDFTYENLKINPLPNGWVGISAAVPFAIWFFLAIEGVANVAEETINPQKTILKGFGTALLTLVVLCILTFLGATGIAGWKAIVYPQGSTIPSDAPLPMALHQFHQNTLIYATIGIFGLFGLVASFNGIVLASGRATFEMGRAGFAPKRLANVHPKFKTPTNALAINMLIGLCSILTGQTGELIIIACFGAITLYILSMIAFIKLRKNEPEILRPFKAPLPFIAPRIVILIASVCLISMLYHYFIQGSIFLLFILIAYIGNLGITKLQK